MKNAIFIGLFLCYGSLFSTGCNQTASKKEPTTESTQMHHESDKNHARMATYTCPMHPEVKSDKPGKCPKCGMELVKAKMDHTQMNDSSSRSQ